MRKIFLADAHLQHPADTNYRTLLRFLQSLTGSTDTLFIMGDLFEFAIGYPAAAFPHYRPVLDALRDLATSGTDIVYFEGNHDFLLARFLEEIPRLRLHPSPVDLIVDGLQTHLCHGDAINRHDRAYRMTRSILRSPLVKLLLGVVPSSGAAWVAREMGRRSRSRHQRNDSVWDPRALLNRYAAEQFDRGCSLVVSGHYHRPFLERQEAGTLVSLGDWITQYSYGVMEDGKISLKVYSG